MIKVAPSDFVRGVSSIWQRDIRSLPAAGADYVHVDVMDGQVAFRNITIGIPVVAAISRIAPLPLDVHLMIERPIRYVDAFCKAGSSILTLHVEADTQENTLEALRRIRENGVRAAISVKPNTPAEAVLPFLPLCDLILVVMTARAGLWRTVVPAQYHAEAASDPPVDRRAEPSLPGWRLTAASMWRRQRSAAITARTSSSRAAPISRPPTPQPLSAR